MRSVPNLEFMISNQHKLTQVFLKLKLPYINSGAGLSQTNFLASPMMMSGPS